MSTIIPQNPASALRRLLDQGCEITFVADPEGIVAHIDTRDDDGQAVTHTGIGDTPEGALSAAAAGAALYAGDNAEPEPAWCEVTEPGHDQHIGMHALDVDTAVLIARTSDGALTAEIIGDEGTTAEGSVALSAAALARLAEIAATL